MRRTRWDESTLNELGVFVSMVKVTLYMGPLRVSSTGTTILIWPFESVKNVEGFVLMILDRLLTDAWRYGHVITYGVSSA